MDKQVEQKYNKFKENPLEFSTMIAQLNATKECVFVPLLVTTKQQIIRAYVKALCDNNLVTEEEYHKMTDCLSETEYLMKELHNEK